MNQSQSAGRLTQPPGMGGASSPRHFHLMSSEPPSSTRMVELQGRSDATTMSEALVMTASAANCARDVWKHALGTQWSGTADRLAVSVWHARLTCAMTPSTSVKLLHDASRSGESGGPG